MFAMVDAYSHLLARLRLRVSCQQSKWCWVLRRASLGPKEVSPTNNEDKTVIMVSSSNTCASAYCNQGWSEVLTHMSPYGYANFGIAFGLGLSVVGAAWGIWLTGSSLVGAAVKSPRIRSKNLIR